MKNDQLIFSASFLAGILHEVPSPYEISSCLSVKIHAYTCVMLAPGMQDYCCIQSKYHAQSVKVIGMIVAMAGDIQAHKYRGFMCINGDLNLSSCCGWVYLYL